MLKEDLGHWFYEGRMIKILMKQLNTYGCLFLFPLWSLKILFKVLGSVVGSIAKLIYNPNFTEWQNNRHSAWEHWLVLLDQGFSQEWKCVVKEMVVLFYQPERAYKATHKSGGRSVMILTQKRTLFTSKNQLLYRLLLFGMMGPLSKVCWESVTFGMLQKELSKFNK